MRSKADGKVIIEYVKTALIAVLFCLAIVQASLYIARAQRLTFSNEVPINSLKIIKNGDKTALASFERNYIMPEFIGYRYENTRKGVSGNNELVADIFDTTCDCIVNVLGNSYTCRGLNESEIEDEFVNIENAEYYVYVRFPAALPYPFIYSLCGEKNNLFINDVASGEMFALKDMVIICSLNSDDGTDLYYYYAIASDGEGSYYGFYPDENSKNTEYYDFVRLSAYNTNDSLNSFHFAFEEKEYSHIVLPSLFPLENTSQKHAALSCRSTAKEIMNDGFPEMITEMLGFDKEKANRYNDNAELVFVDSNGTMKFNEETGAAFNYDTKSKSLTLSAILNYENYNGKYNAYEYLLATEIIAKNILEWDREKIFKDAEIKLVSLNYDEDSLTAEYGYFIDNIPVYIGESNIAIRITAGDRRVKKLEIYPYMIITENIYSSNIPMKWSLSRVNDNASSKLKGIPEQRYTMGSDYIYYVNNVFLSETIQ